MISLEEYRNIQNAAYLTIVPAVSRGMLDSFRFQCMAINACAAHIINKAFDSTRVNLAYPVPCRVSHDWPESSISSIGFYQHVAIIACADDGANKPWILDFTVPDMFRNEDLPMPSWQTQYSLGVIEISKPVESLISFEFLKEDHEWSKECAEVEDFEDMKFYKEMAVEIYLREDLRSPACEFWNLSEAEPRGSLCDIEGIECDEMGRIVERQAG